MSKFEAKIVIDVPDGVDIGPVIEQVRQILSAANGKDTRINIVEVDDPVSANPVRNRGR